MLSAEPLISVIVPLYNTQQYIEEAIVSIQAQSLSDFEIIVVDDGSSDSSAEIVEKLSVEDSRIRLYRQINQGQSVARNYALKYAKGKYIYMMDSDDRILPDTFSLCYRKIVDSNADLVMFDADIFGNNIMFDNNQYHNTKHFEDRVYQSVEIVETLVDKRRFNPSVCLLFFKKSLLDQSGLRFYPGIIHEDNLFTFRLFLSADKIAIVHKALFERRVRDNSTMTTAFSMKNIRGYMAVNDQLEIFGKSQSTQIRMLIRRYLNYTWDAVVQRSYSLSVQDRIRVFRWVLSRRRRVSTKSFVILFIKKYIRK